MRIQYEKEAITTFTIIPVIAFLMLVIWSLVLAWPVKLLWNWLIPGIFGLGKITFFQAFGLKFLLGLILGKMSIEDNRKKQ